jgi:hypothetical protein
MTTGLLLATIAGTVAALFSGVFWIKAAYAKVEADPPGNVGVGYGGVPVNVKNHDGTVVDFLKTYTLQSKWNSWAALTSGIAALFGMSAFVLQTIIAFKQAHGG